MATASILSIPFILFILFILSNSVRLPLSQIRTTTLPDSAEVFRQDERDEEDEQDCFGGCRSSGLRAVHSLATRRRIQG